MRTWVYPNIWVLSVLGLGGSLLIGAPASADSVTVIADPATIVETAPLRPIFVERYAPRMVLPLPTVTTIQQTLPVVVEPSQSTTTTVVEKKTTVQPKTEIKEQLILQSRAAGKPDFITRLSMMKDWINDSQAKGFLSSEEAQSFLSEHASLVSLESELQARGGEKAMADDLEKRLNVLNARVADSMSGPSLAGKGLVR